MGGSNILKQLKKLIRRKRRWMTLGIWLIMIAALTFAVNSMGQVADTNAAIPISKHNSDIMSTILHSSVDREVKIQKIYVCGEEIEHSGKLHPQQIVKLQADHPQWIISLLSDGAIQFSEKINDLSPNCKKEAYFSVDEFGNLTLFQGFPKEKKVIRTFFQLNIERLKTSLPHETVNQLYDGIQIKDLAEYNSVLSTFSDYAIEELSHQ